MNGYWLYVDTRRPRNRKTGENHPSSGVVATRRKYNGLTRSFVRSFARIVQSRGTSLRVNTIMYNLCFFFFFVFLNLLSVFLRLHLLSHSWLLSFGVEPYSDKTPAR